MTASRGESMRAELGWDKPLRYRRGAKQRLRGIDVFHDLRWSDYFTSRRVMFLNGQCLADQIVDDCPSGKRPALLLTDRDEIEEGARETDVSYAVVVNLPRYLETAQSNAAATYLAQRLGRGITRAKSFSEATVPDHEVDELLEDHLDATSLARWVGENSDRISMLQTLAAQRGGSADDSGDSVERAIAALESLEGLDPRITEAVAVLAMAEPDLGARAELLWALTEDADGRHNAGEVLQARTTDRLEDAREAARAFDRLLKKASETDVQRFLESNPWLLGLDYARVRPRQQVPRGAVDFLLERFDGFHDLLELKGPGDAIFETHGQQTSTNSPSSYRLSRPLALALAQVHAYRDVLSYEDAVEGLYGLPHGRDPRITILIGRVASLSDQEKRLLKELNRSLHRVEIVPFDVLARRAYAILDSVERYLIAAEEETAD